MGRSAKYTNSDFIRAGLQMAAEGGPASVTMAGLSSRAGAPLGSVYHRFQSRRVLMGELWLGLVESFQHGFLAELSGGDMTSTALYTLRWARARPLEARVLMLHRRQDFTGPGWPAGMRTRAGSLAGELNQGLEDFAFRHFGREDSEAMDRVVFALIDVPYATVRRRLESGLDLPFHLDVMVLESCRAVLGGGV